MTEIVGKGSIRPPDFGLPSDRGGKDLGVFLPMANGGWILSTNSPIQARLPDYFLQTTDSYK